jgi:protein-L-isoaspartate(D-aspartate) O-methyltransferase
MTTVQDWRERNDRMVDRLVERQRLDDSRVEEALRTVPRHAFLPGVDLERVYSGAAVPTQARSDGVSTSSSSEPRLMARMLDRLRVLPGMHVLEIGTGTGYNAAILAHLVGDSGAVTTIEVDPTVARQARANLDRAGFERVRVITRDGWDGADEYGPYDRIELTVGTWDISPRWVEQLRSDGLLLVALWLRAGVHLGITFRAIGPGRLRSESVITCGFMRLRGPHRGPGGWEAVAEWIAAVDERAEQRRSALCQLLREPPTVTEIAEPSQGWFLAIALQDDDAIQLVHQRDHDRRAAGVLIENPPSLAVIEGGRLTSYGAPLAADLLRAHLALEPVVLPEQIVVEADRSDLPHDISAPWRMRRAEFDVQARLVAHA